MAVLDRLLDRLATRRGLTTLLILWTLIYLPILWTLWQLHQSTGDVRIPDFMPIFDSADIRARFDSFGTDGFALYRRIQRLDLVNPALYGLVAAALLRRLWRDRRRALVLLPLIAALFDYAENAGIHALVASYPDLNPGSVTLAAGLGLVKWVSLLGTAAALIAGLAARRTGPRR